MEALLNLQSVSGTPASLKSMRHFLDTVESQVRSLRTLGVASESYGCLLSSVIMAKLPPDIRLIVSREVKEEEWQLDPLLKLVEREVKARERSTASSIPVSNTTPKTPPRFPPLLPVVQVLQAVYIVKIHIRPYHVRKLWEQNPEGQYLRVLEDASCVFAKTILVGIVDQIQSVTTAKGVTTRVSVLDEIARIQRILILDSLIRIQQLSVYFNRPDPTSDIHACQHCHFCVVANCMGDSVQS